jgi:hypothetical protein
MVSLPNVINADVTTALRDFGAEVARDVYSSPTKLLGWAATALEAAMPNLEPNADESTVHTSHPATKYVIVDRSLTRC